MLPWRGSLQSSTKLKHRSNSRVASCALHKAPRSRQHAVCEAASSASGLSSTVPEQPPVLAQQEYAEEWHGHVRRDEYRWLSEKHATHPEVLSYLKSESQHTISSLANTKELQLQIQQDIQDWQQQSRGQTDDEQQQQQSFEPDEHRAHAGDSQGGKGQQQQQQQQQQRAVLPDWLAGSGHLQYKQLKQFGFPGLIIGSYRFFSVPANDNTSSLIHCRAPVEGDNPAYATTATGINAAARTSQRGSNSRKDDSTGPNIPLGTVSLWGDAGSGGSSSSSAARLLRSRSTKVHSLAVSPCGGYLAVTYSCNSSRTHDLAVVDCSTGELVLQPFQGVDGPILWVAAAEPAAGAAAAGALQQQQQKQHFLVYVANDCREVYCLPVSGSTRQKGRCAAAAAAAAGRGTTETNTAASPAAAAAATASTTGVLAAAAAAARHEAATTAPRLLFRDPQHVSVGIAAAGHDTFTTVFGADGLVRQVRYYTAEPGYPSDDSCSVNSSDTTTISSSSSRHCLPDQSEAWQVLLPAKTVASILAKHAAAAAGSGAGAATAAAEAAAAIAAAGDDDPTARLAVSAVDDMLVARYSSAALPQGMLLLGKRQRQQQQGRKDLQWQLLLAAQEQFYLEAVFVCPVHSSSSDSSSSSTGDSEAKELQLIVLGWQQYDWQQQQRRPQQAVDLDAAADVSGVLQARQELQVQLYTLWLPDSHHAQQQQQQKQQQRWLLPPKLQLQYTCTLPIPDAVYEVHSASWRPELQELHLELSSLVRPRTKMIVNVPELAMQQQQQAGFVAVHGHSNMSIVTTARSVQLQQLAASPAGFDQSDYTITQIGVPSLDGRVTIPVSLAYNQQKVQLPAALTSLLSTSSCHSSALTSPQPHQQQQQHSMHAVAWHSLHSNESVAVGTPADASPAEEIPTVTVTATSDPSSSTTRRLLLSCYGSYGIRESVAFDPELLQLIDAGWVVAVAHVRGGGWCGRDWAEGGRGMRKPNSVNDLLAVAEYIHKLGLVSPGYLCLQGASAGGWLAASAMLQQPQLFAAVVLTVPCLDPLGLLLQQSHGELELGPAATDPKVYNSIRSWAPYDLLEKLLDPETLQQQQQQQDSETLQQQLVSGAPHHQQQQQQQVAPAMHAAAVAAGLKHAIQLPHVLVRAALNDPEVPISDPVKALARLRRYYSMLGQQEQQQRNLQSGDSCGGTQHERVSGVQHTSGDLNAQLAAQQKLLLLRVVPGGHLAFKGSIKESALKIPLCFAGIAASALWANVVASYVSAAGLAVISYALFACTSGVLVSATLLIAPQAHKGLTRYLPGLIDCVLSAVWAVLFLALGISLLVAPQGTCTRFVSSLEHQLQQQQIQAAAQGPTVVASPFVAAAGGSSSSSSSSSLGTVLPQTDPTTGVSATLLPDGEVLLNTTAVAATAAPAPAPSSSAAASSSGEVTATGQAGSLAATTTAAADTVYWQLASKQRQGATSSTLVITATPAGQIILTEADDSDADVATSSTPSATATGPTSGTSDQALQADLATLSDYLESLGVLDSNPGAHSPATPSTTVLPGGIFGRKLLTTAAAGDLTSVSSTSGALAAKLQVFTPQLTDAVCAAWNVLLAVSFANFVLFCGSAVLAVFDMRDGKGLRVLCLARRSRGESSRIESGRVVEVTGSAVAVGYPVLQPEGGFVVGVPLIRSSSGSMYTAHVTISGSNLRGTAIEEGSGDAVGTGGAVSITPSVAAQFE